MSLIARHFEVRGVPTVILGGALDILTAGQPPRAAFLNYPLGHEAGRPFDSDDQYSVLKQALTLVDTQTQPGIVHLENSWPEGWDAVRREADDTDGQDLRSPRDETPRYERTEDEALALRLGATAPPARRAI